MQSNGNEQSTYVPFKECIDRSKAIPMIGNSSGSILSIFLDLYPIRLYLYVILNRKYRGPWPRRQTRDIPLATSYGVARAKCGGGIGGRRGVRVGLILVVQRARSATVEIHID